MSYSQEALSRSWRGPRAKQEEIIADLRKQNAEQELLITELEGEVARAIDILDGNAEGVDWRDKKQPELLRKLCEHLEVFHRLEDQANHIGGDR
jgi:hypothetical protein